MHDTFDKTLSNQLILPIICSFSVLLRHGPQKEGYSCPVKRSNDISFLGSPRTQPVPAIRCDEKASVNAGDESVLPPAFIRTIFLGDEGVLFRLRDIEQDLMRGNMASKVSNPSLRADFRVLGYQIAGLWVRLDARSATRVEHVVKDCLDIVLLSVVFRCGDDHGLGWMLQGQQLGHLPAPQTELQGFRTNIE